MLVQGHRHFQPTRHGAQGEIDDPIKWGFHVRKSLAFLKQVPYKSSFRLTRAFADQQSSDVFGAGLRLGDEEAEVEDGEFAHGCNSFRETERPL